MGFRNSKQRSDICHIFLKMKNLDRFYVGSDIGASGFTENFEGEIILIKAHESSLSIGEQTLCLVVKDFWNGGGGAKVYDVMANLDRGVVRAIGELMTASAQHDSSFIDEWKVQWNGFDPDQDYFSS